MSSLYPRSSSQSTPNVMPVSAAWIARRYSVFCDGSKVRGSTPLRARRTGATTPAVSTKDAVQPESPKKTRHPPHGTSHRSRTVSRSKNLSSAMSSSPLDDASALGVLFAALSAMDPGWDGGIGTPLRRRKRFSFSSSSTPPPAARSASRSPRALAGDDETRRHPPTSTRVRHVRVTRVARRGTETPTHATIEIDAIAIECLDVSVERVRGRSPEPCARQRSGLGWYSARWEIFYSAQRARDVASLVNTTATASLIARAASAHAHAASTPIPVR